MIHIIGKGNGEAVVFDDESPPEDRAELPPMTEADFWEAVVGEEDLKPAHSNAAPPGSE